jgi:hypothetical protein
MGKERIRCPAAISAFERVWRKDFGDHRRTLVPR